MNRRRADRASLQERIHGAPLPKDEHAAPAPAPPPRDPSRVRQYWVTDEDGRLAALLLEWRQTPSGWQGHVVWPVLENGCWLVVEEWLPARLLSAG